MGMSFYGLLLTLLVIDSVTVARVARSQSASRASGLCECGQLPLQEVRPLHTNKSWEKAFQAEYRLFYTLNGCSSQGMVNIAFNNHIFAVFYGQSTQKSAFYER